MFEKAARQKSVLKMIRSFCIKFKTLCQENIKTEKEVRQDPVLKLRILFSVEFKI